MCCAKLISHKYDVRNERIGKLYIMLDKMLTIIVNFIILAKFLPRFSARHRSSIIQFNFLFATTRKRFYLKHYNVDKLSLNFDTLFAFARFQCIHTSFTLNVNFYFLLARLRKKLNDLIRNQFLKVFVEGTLRFIRLTPAQDLWVNEEKNNANVRKQ